MSEGVGEISAISAFLFVKLLLLTQLILFYNTCCHQINQVRSREIDVTSGLLSASEISRYLSTKTLSNNNSNSKSSISNNTSNKNPHKSKDTEEKKKKKNEGEGYDGEEETKKLLALPLSSLTAESIQASKR